MKITLDTSSRYFQTFFTLALLAFSILLIGSAAYSWTSPAGTAPNNNVEAPVNVGSASQIKSGPLQVNGFINNGSTQLTGNLGIGIAPQSAWRIYAPGSAYGIYAEATDGQAIRGQAATGYAGYFTTSGTGGGVFVQNGQGAYVYLGYPNNATWAVYTNRSMYAASQMRADGGFCIGGSCKTSWALPQSSCYWTTAGAGHGGQYGWGAAVCSAGYYMAGINWYKVPGGVDDEAINILCCYSN